MAMEKFYGQMKRTDIILKPDNKIYSGLFVDRDGVIIEDKHYINDPQEVVLCDGSKELLVEATKQEWRIIVITNQSGISKGIVTWDDYKLVNERMIELLGKEVKISAIFANAHPATTHQPLDSWRKPSPNMILAATKVYNIDIRSSILIGDRISDLVSGVRANIPKLVHVLTGHGNEERINIWQNKDLASHRCSGKLQLLNSLKDFAIDSLGA